MTEQTHQHLINASEILEAALGEWVSVSTAFYPNNALVAMKEAYDEIELALMRRNHETGTPRVD